MLEQFNALTEEYDMLPRGGTVLCAVSGGADSMCLLHIVQGMAPRLGLTVAAAHYNHRLRGGEADRDEAFVREYCQKNGIPCVVGSGDVAGEAARRGRGIEETARELRYAFLRDTAARMGADRIATAHNADDNAETLILHLARGAGLQGLAGIAPRRGELVRPLLTTSRAEIEAYLTERGVPHVEDSTNADTAYTRNQVRWKIMPLLRELNPRLTESLSDTARYLRNDNDYLNARAAELCLHARWAEDNLVIEARFLAGAPAALASRAARRLLEMMGDGNTDVTAAHLNAIVDLCRGDDPSAVAFLPGGLLAQRVYRELLLTTEQDPLPPFAPVPLAFDGAVEACGWRVACRPITCPQEQEHSAVHFYLSRALVGADAVLRPRAQGDEISLPRRGTKTVKKLLIDEKIPRRLRERVPLLADASGILAAAGFGPDESRLAAPGEEALELTFYKIETEIKA